MLALVGGAPSTESDPTVRGAAKFGSPSTESASGVRGPVTAIVAIASNSSLCGGFNANAIAKVRSVRHAGDVVYSIGRKMADAMRKDGFASPEDFTALSDHPEYAPASALVEKLLEEWQNGRFGQVLLVYNHFVSTARQEPVVEDLLAVLKGSDAEEGVSLSPDIIIEPGKKELLEILEPKVMKLKLYAALLDSAAAEHAARTVAMQTATDNAENLLQELTLQYNKGRQQKITSEILDLAGGQAQE
jgi:F-type H+-transporting ATPase subunit gamma